MYTKHLKPFWRISCFAAAMVSAGIATAGENDTLADMVSDDMSFAVAVPDGFRLENGDATLDLEYTAGSTTLQETISLNISRSETFASAVDASGDVYVGRLGTAAKEQFEQFQQAVARNEATGVEGNGGLAVSVTGGCFSGAPLDELPISTWVQMDASQGYFEIIKDRDLFSMLDQPTRQRLMANLRSCE